MEVAAAGASPALVPCYVYTVAFDPLLHNHAWPHLGERKHFRGFWLLFSDLITEEVRVIGTHKQRRVAVSIRLRSNDIMYLSPEQVNLLNEFHAVYLSTILKLPPKKVLHYPSPKKGRRGRGEGVVFVVPRFADASGLEGDTDLYTLELLLRTQPAKQLLDAELQLCAHDINNAMRRIRQLFNGRAVRTRYNDSTYMIVLVCLSYLVSGLMVDLRDVDFGLSPESSFQRRRGEGQCTFVEYYAERRGIVISDMKQPLLVHGTGQPMYPADVHVEAEDECGERAVGEGPTSGEMKEVDGHVLLVPELCELLSFTWELFEYGKFIPAIVWHMRWMVNYEYLQQHVLRYAFSGETRSLLRYALTHPSYSNEHEGPLTNYQRLEFLGDAVLEFIVSSKLFRRFPTKNEGALTRMRRDLVSNSFLAKLATSIGLEDYILVRKKHKLDKPTRMNMLADVFEAVMAVLYLDGGLTPVGDLFSMCVSRESSPMALNWNAPSESVPPDLPVEEDLVESCKQVEENIGYKFSRSALLVQAFTHPSFYWNKYIHWSLRRHYQRVEFLGDTILKLVTSLYLYRNFPTASEGELTMCRAGMVNNETLAECSMFLGLQNHLRHQLRVRCSSPESERSPSAEEANPPKATSRGKRRQRTPIGKRSMDSYELTAKVPYQEVEMSSFASKLYGDLFEALLGAVFLDEDCSLKTCSRLVGEVLIRRSQIDPDEQVLDPKSFYQYLVQGECWPVPSYKVLSCTVTETGRIVRAGLFIADQLVAEGCGDSKKRATKAAALGGIGVYMAGYHYHIGDTSSHKPAHRHAAVMKKSPAEK